MNSVVISALVNTLNEEANLPFCLRSLRWCDEVVVVDMQSEDQTREIAARSGAKVYTIARAGFVEPAREASIARCSGAWVLIVDADEVIPPALAARLRAVAEGDACDGVLIPRRNYVFGDWLRHRGVWPDYKPRFARKGHYVTGPTIHEGLGFTSGSRVMRLPADPEVAIAHFNNRDVADHTGRAVRYEAIAAAQAYARGVRFSLLKCIGGPPLATFRRYVWRKAFREGARGAVASALSGVSRLLFWLNVWAIQNDVAVQQDELRRCLVDSWFPEEAGE
jgi:glycosyltransferase involved in cell wall biosynthesis